MIKLMVTRFNNVTWEENLRWRERENFTGCIYNCPNHIKETITLLLPIYVVEMNNDKNKIMGIGKIINKVYTNRKYKIYSDNNYNRYTYKGKIRIDRNEIIKLESKMIEYVESLEKKLFKGYKHLKRGQGITSVSEDISREFLSIIEKKIFINL